MGFKKNRNMKYGKKPEGIKECEHRLYCTCIFIFVVFHLVSLCRICLSF